VLRRRIVEVHAPVLFAEESLQLFVLIVYSVEDPFVSRVEGQVRVLANADLFVLPEEVIRHRFVRPHAEPQHVPLFPLLHEGDVTLLLLARADNFLAFFSGDADLVCARLKSGETNIYIAFDQTVGVK